jgi:hypothetical protein
MSQRPSSRRGSALLLVMVLLAILSVIGVMVINRSTSEALSAQAKARFDKSVSCADAARELLVSQFRTYGTSPTLLTLDRTIEDKRLASGHYDNIAVTSVVATSGASQANIGVSDISNRVARTKLGGQMYRMTVVCASTGADGGPTRQNEVEYLVRFGI